ncbi:toll-like receptor 4 [Trichonephila clavipes]|nr:toll-like receptor 4 [Trichonephila clavipes]
MQNLDYQQPSEKDIVQPEDISNIPAEKYLENVGFEFEKYVDVEILETNGLPLDNGSGQSFDNAAIISGRYNDVQAVPKEKNKFANYVPCTEHSLNLLYRIAIAIIKILGQTVKTFGFPKEDFLRKKWIQAISRKDFVPSKYSKVCELHFSDDAIRRYTEGGYILGMAYNSEQAATSAYVFMIQSLLSPLLEVVHIMPVKIIDGEKLFAVVKKLS